jgi:NADP-dependent 3-hydroxy acid dehydrogenase YdfG
MKDLKGKTAFVTGGASGIGLGMARAFLGAGMNVVIADLRADHLAQAAQALSAHDNRIRLIQLDVTDRAAFAEAADETEAAFGAIHLLCNNAGIGLSRSIGTADYKDWDWAVDVNLNAIFNGVHIMLPRLRGHGQGAHIVNTASMAGILNYSAAGIYVATKFAVVGFSEALRAELAGEGIGVSVFCPGGVRSNIRDYEKSRPDRFRVDDAPAPAGPPPGFAARFTPAQLEKLGSLTAAADAAGEMVLEGVRNNALYIFTAPEFRPGIEARFNAILRALGEDEGRTRTALDLIPGLIGSPIYRES